MTIAIVDYGVGNLRSVERALAHVGAEPVISSDPEVIRAADGVVLPGVGAFEPAIRRLEETGLGGVIAEAKHVLGVCLGYQLLFEESEEGGRRKGLGLLRGRVVRLSAPRVPVIGWARVRQSRTSPLWAGVPDGAWFYFVHSYTPDASDCAIGCADHTEAAASASGNVAGTQFHPEKSGADGLRIYANFAAMCRD